MITHDGGSIVSKSTGIFIKVEDILYIKGGYELDGLTGIKPFDIYFKHTEKPVNFPYNSEVKYEIYDAINLFYVTYPNSYPFIVFRSGYVVNLHNVCNLTRRGIGNNPRYIISFNTGLEVETIPGIYIVLLETLAEAAEKDNNKYTKKTIPGFLHTKR